MTMNKIAKIILISSLLSVNVAAHASPATAINDTTITAKVKAKIAMDKMLSVFKVGVMTNHGIVRLQARLDSEAQASNLIEIVESTDGVRDIDTKRLTVKNSNQPLTDTYITAKIKGKFLQEKLTGTGDVPLESISVETNNGVVYLRGTALTQVDVDNAVQIAKMVSGVKDVKSDIKVGN